MHIFINDRRVASHPTSVLSKLYFRLQIEENIADLHKRSEIVTDEKRRAFWHHLFSKYYTVGRCLTISLMN